MRKTAGIARVTKMARARLQPDQSADSTRRLSAYLGVGLIVLALCGFAWFSVHLAAPGVHFVWPFVGQAGANTSNDPLAAAGITLSTPAQEQPPPVSRAQALFLANQTEAGIAARAGAVDAQYTLLTYKSAQASQPVFQEQPAWMIHYAHINEPPPDKSADSHASRVPHDFYLFLDATTGKTLLALWL